MVTRKKEKTARKNFKGAILFAILLIVLFAALVLYNFFPASYPKIISVSLFPPKVTAGQILLVEVEAKDTLLIK
jgi:hypothetical protein